MASFLQLVAKDLIYKYPHHFKDLVVVFPNKRAGLFLAEALSELIDKPVWMPEILTLNEFIEQRTGLKKAENTTLIIKLYKSYLSIAKTEEKFEDFYYWGNMLLEDFDDVDKYLVQAKSLFSNIVSLQELESNYSYLDPEQLEAIKSFWSSFNPEKYSKEQEDFLKVWSHIYPTYIDFKHHLSAEELCYEGMGQRHFFEHIESYPNDRMVVFAGFNALNKCEKQIFNYYRQSGNALFYWDYDLYYTAGEFHEAGHFMRENLRLFPNELGPEYFNNFKHNGKDIEYIAVPSSIGQAKLIPELVQGIAEKDQVHTALVLCDERLLIPVMHSIPENIGKINITMGYPAQNTSAAALVYMLTELRNYTKIQGDEIYYYYKPVIALLNHKLLKEACPEDINRIIDYVRRKNIVYIAGKALRFNRVTEAIFGCSDEKIPDYLLHILKLLTELPEDKQQELHPIEKEFIFSLYTCIQSLRSTFEEEQIDPDPKLYLQIINKVINSISIPFSGEPLEGLQIMGLQETRMLDFENLILFSANEGIMPKGNTPSSFIPYNLRVGFKLPTPEHQDALFAYYFYRLLQRSKHIKILYTSVTSGIKGGEMSRFLYQIKYESGLLIREQNFQNQISVEDAKPIEIAKNEDILKALEVYTLSEETPLSPSALNIYIDCPLKFYFKYIAGIKEKEEMAEELDHRLLGTIFHECSQSLYATIADQEITPQLIDDLLTKRDLIDTHIRNSYLNFYDKNVTHLIDSGSNELILEIIKKYIRQVFLYDKTLCPFRIISMEKKYVIPQDISIDGNPLKVYIGGIIDRVDQIGSTIRVIDYKTGADTTLFKNIASVFDPTLPNRNKAAFQTLLYCMMFGYHHPEYPTIIPGIYSTKLLFGNDYDYRLKCDQDSIISFDRYKDEFEEQLQQLLQELYSPLQPFIQTTNEKKCRNCPYASICRR